MVWERIELLWAAARGRGRALDHAGAEGLRALLPQMHAKGGPGKGGGLRAGCRNVGIRGTPTALGKREGGNSGCGCFGELHVAAWLSVGRWEVLHPMHPLHVEGEGCALKSLQELCIGVWSHAGAAVPGRRWCWVKADELGSLTLVMCWCLVSV